MNKHKPIRLGRGFTPVYIYVALTAKAWRKLTKGVKDCPDFPSELHASCTDFAPIDGQAPFAIITLNKRYIKHGIVVGSLVAHEAVHCKQFCERMMRTTFDIETEAYYIQHIVQDVMKAIKPFRKK
jgi:hypothetical protein